MAFEKELKKTEREKKLEKNLEEEEKKEGVDVDIEIHSNPFMDRMRDFTGGEVGDGVFTLPFGIEIPNIFHGGGGIGGNDTIQATTPIMGGDGATIQFWGEQGRDLSGEPGVDFSYKDYKSNYSTCFFCHNSLTHYAILTKTRENVPLSLPDLPKPTRTLKSAGKP